MKSLSANLDRAWRSGGEPYLRVIVDDRLAHGERFLWTEVANDGTDPGLGHGAAVGTTGTIHRARFVSNGVSYDLQTARITNPDDAAQWTAWTTRVAGIASTYRDCAVATRANGEVWVLWGEQLGGTAPALRAITSANDGAAWGAPTTVQSWGSGVIGQVAAAESPGGNLGVAYTLDTGGGFLARVALRVSGVWSDWADTAGAGVTATRGIGFVWTGATAATATYVADDPSRFEVRLVAGLDGVTAPAWAAGLGFLRQAGGSATLYRSPRLAPLAGQGASVPGYFLTYVEHDGASARLMGAFSRRSEWFVAPFEVARIAAGSGYGPQSGAALLVRSERYWLVGYGSARWSALWTGAAGTGDSVELPPERIVAVEEIERAFDGSSGGQLTLVLDNADGALAGAGVSGTYRALRAGSRLALGLGYRYAGGAEAVWGIPWVIERVEWLDGAGVGRLIVRAIDLWRLLRRTPLANDLRITDRTLAWLADRLIWRYRDADTAALEARLGSHTVSATGLRAGESLGSTLERLTDAVGVWARFAVAATTSDPTGFDSWLNPAFLRWDTAASVASYGPDPASGGPIRRAAWWRGSRAVNRVRVLGKDPATVDVASDPAHAALHGLDGWGAERRELAGDPLWVRDLAAWEIARQRAGDTGGWLDSNPHPGLELYDVVAVTAPRAGLNAALRRVVGRRTRYDRRAAEWAQRLWLAGV